MHHKKPKPEKRTRNSLPPHVALSQIVELTDAFCREHLNEEYREICTRMGAELADLEPSPLTRGTPATWACAIVRTVGWVNFLHDRSQSPHLRPSQIDKSFGVAESTAQTRSRSIRKMLDIGDFDHRWTLPSRMDDTRMIWMLQSPTGFVFDIRKQPLEVQRMAFHRGLIPYVPADRPAEEARKKIESSQNRRLFQFKVTLLGTDPPVWRRIQVLDCTLDQLHEHLQMAMGWSNSHLHEFLIEGRRAGDPELLEDSLGELDGINSTKKPLSRLIPENSAGFKFHYVYDLGDCWEHEILFEGCPPKRPQEVYPQCTEGERACPPEDVGGVYGFYDYLEAIRDPEHERHEELIEWLSPFDPDRFSPKLATNAMQEGMPGWRQRPGIE